MSIKMPFIPSVKEEKEKIPAKKVSPALDAAIKRRMKLTKQTEESAQVSKTKKVGY